MSKLLNSSHKVQFKLHFNFFQRGLLSPKEITDIEQLALQRKVIILYFNILYFNIFVFLYFFIERSLRSIKRSLTQILQLRSLAKALLVIYIFCAKNFNNLYFNLMWLSTIWYIHWFPFYTKRLKQQYTYEDKTNLRNMSAFTEPTFIKWFEMID